MTPTLTQGPIATNVDERIANLITALSSEGTPEAETAVWALRSLQVARRALVAIQKTSHPIAVMQLAREGLEVAPE